MNRKTFINQMTGGLTLTCVACMMQACSKEDGTTPTNTTTNGNTNTNTPTAPNALLTVNLTTQLLSVNDFILDNGVIVVRIATGNAVTSFVAFSSACPHAGANISYVKSSNSFNCSAHGSNFAINGAVTNGPASSPLEKKTIEIVGDKLNVK